VAVVHSVAAKGGVATAAELVGATAMVGVGGTDGVTAAGAAQEVASRAARSRARKWIFMPIL